MYSVKAKIYENHYEKYIEHSTPDILTGQLCWLSLCLQHLSIKPGLIAPIQKVFTISESNPTSIISIQDGNMHIE